MRGAIGLKPRRPFAAQSRAALARIESRVNVGGNLERGVRPAKRRSRRRDFLLAERCAVRFRSACFRRRAFRDHGLAAQQRRLVVDCARGAYRAIDRRDVMAVDVRDHMPAVRFETLRGIVGKPTARLAVNRNSVVVVERGQLAEPERSRERARLVGNAFHQAAVAGEHVRAVIDDCVSGTVEPGCEQFFRECHADGVREPLPERSGRRLNARCHADLRMSGRLGMELAKSLQFGHRQFVPAQVQQRVLQHRAVAVRQHEAIAIDPMRIRWIVSQMACPQRDGNFRHAHRHTRMSRFRLFDGVHRERANRVGELMIRCALDGRAAARCCRGVRHGCSDGWAACVRAVEGISTRRN